MKLGPLDGETKIEDCTFYGMQGVSGDLSGPTGMQGLTSGPNGPTGSVGRTVPPRLGGIMWVDMTGAQHSVTCHYGQCKRCGDELETCGPLCAMCGRVPTLREARWVCLLRWLLS
jgi:hypothetical protein